jgi:hypothetical protein
MLFAIQNHKIIFAVANNQNAFHIPVLLQGGQGSSTQPRTHPVVFIKTGNKLLKLMLLGTLGKCDFSDSS